MNLTSGGGPKRETDFVIWDDCICAIFALTDLLVNLSIHSVILMLLFIR